MTKPSRAEISEFLDLLWPEDPPHEVVIWTMSDRRSRWVSLDDIPKVAAHACQTDDVYFSVCSHDWELAKAEAKRKGREESRKLRRGSGQSATALSAVWADIDCAGGEHARSDLPNKEDALAFLSSLEQPPSIIVDSGGGFHAYWLLDEILLLDSDSKRVSVKRRIKAFEALVREKMQEHGWHLDSTAELSRVLRLPGTFNRKSARPRPVSIVDANPDRRYSFDELAPPVQPKRDRSKQRTAHVANGSADAACISENCGWFSHTRNDARDLREPEWHAALGILGHCKNGDDLAHEWSREHPNYSQDQTDRKLNHARESAGPRTCATIRDELSGERFCSECPHWGNITSPLELGDPEHPAITWPWVKEQVERIRDGDPEAAYEQDFLRRVARLLKSAPDKYAIVMQRLDGSIKKRHFESALRQCRRGRSRQSRAKSRLPQILVSDRPFREIVKDSWQAIFDGNTPPQVFKRRGTIVRIAHGSFPHIEVMSVDAMIGRLFRSADFLRETREGVVHIKPDKDIVRDMIAYPSDLPELEALATIPTLDRGGDLINAPGYHSQARIFMPDNALLIDDLPETPTSDEVSASRRLLLVELLGDFPFEGESDLAHTIGAMLVPFVRFLIDAPSPLHLIEAPTPGSGKTLLAGAVSIPVLGRPVSAQPISDHDDEMRKMITAMLLSDVPVLLLDNASQKATLDNPYLSAALTTTEWRDRILGHSRIVSVSNRVLWLLTGNNPRLSMEMARRSVRIRLDPQRDRPWLRDEFRHPKLLIWAMKRRADLARSLLILIQNWRAEGAPRSDVTLGSFENWAGIVGGILEVNGIRGFLGNLHDLYREADQEGDALRSFVATWQEIYKSNLVTVSDLCDMCERYGLLLETLGDGNERSKRTRLGVLLSSLRDRVFRDSRIVSRKRHHQREYHLERTDGTSEATKRSEQGRVQSTRMRSRGTRSRRGRRRRD